MRPSKYFLQKILSPILAFLFPCRYPTISYLRGVAKRERAWPAYSHPFRWPATYPLTSTTIRLISATLSGAINQEACDDIVLSLISCCEDPSFSERLVCHASHYFVIIIICNNHHSSRLSVLVLYVVQVAGFLFNYSRSLGWYWW